MNKFTRICLIILSSTIACTLLPSCSAEKNDIKDVEPQNQDGNSSIVISRSSGRVISVIDIYVKKKKLDYDNVWPQSIVAAHDGQYAILTNDGTIWAWHADFSKKDIDSDNYFDEFYFQFGTEPKAVKGIDNIVSITYCMAVRADGTVYRWRDQNNDIKIQKIRGIENALHVFQFDYDRYLVLLQDRSLLYVENSNINPIRSVTDVLDYESYHIITNTGCVYLFEAEADYSILKHEPKSPGEEAINIGQCSQGTVIQSRDGESYIVRETSSEEVVPYESTEYFIQFDGVALTKGETLIEPEIYNTVYTDGELIITLEGDIYQMLSRYYKNSETYIWDQDSSPDRVLIKVEPENLNLQYLVDHNRYKLKEAYIPNEMYDASLAYLIMAGQ